MWRQIFGGSCVLAICAAVHLAVITLGLEWLLVFQGDTAFARFAIFALAFGTVLAGHTSQVWIWALFFVRRGAFSSFEDAAYFALVTTTTLGYGDVTLERHHRLFGAMAAVCGLLTFGFSTAFLIAVLRGFVADAAM